MSSRLRSSLVFFSGSHPFSFCLYFSFSRFPKSSSLLQHLCFHQSKFSINPIDSKFHLLSGHSLHDINLCPRSSVRRPLLTLQLSRQISASRPHRCPLHASHRCRRIKFQRTIRQSRLIFFFLHPSSFTLSLLILSRPCLLQHHHRHPHRRQRPLTP